MNELRGGDGGAGEGAREAGEAGIGRKGGREGRESRERATRTKEDVVGGRLRREPSRPDMWERSPILYASQDRCYDVRSPERASLLSGTLTIVSS